MPCWAIRFHPSQRLFSRLINLISGNLVDRVTRCKQKQRSGWDVPFNKFLNYMAPKQEQLSRSAVSVSNPPQRKMALEIPFWIRPLEWLSIKLSSWQITKTTQWVPEVQRSMCFLKAIKLGINWKIKDLPYPVGVLPLAEASPGDGVACGLGSHKHSSSPKLPLVFASGYVNTARVLYFLNIVFILYSLA